MINNIKAISKMFIQSHLERLNLITNSKKLNTKSIYLWLIIILTLVVFLISQTVVSFLVDYGMEDFFAKGVIIFIMIIVTFQAITILLNLLFFSSDTNKYLPLPISSKELLISKYIATLIIIYMSEIFIALCPLLVYVVYAKTNFVGVINILLVLILMPIVIVNIMLAINFILITSMKVIKNKKVYQNVATMIFLGALVFGVTGFLNQIIKNGGSNVEEIVMQINDNIIISKIFCNIGVGEKSYFLSGLVLIVSVITLYIIVAICEKNYLNILKDLNNYNKKKTKQVDCIKQCKVSSPNIAYIKNEVLRLIRVPEYLMQLVYPVVLMQISLLSIGIIFVEKMLTTDIELQESLLEMGFNVQGFGTLLSLIILIISFNNISITSISRFGKEANRIKAFPISFKRQFILKNVPQIALNTVTILIISILAYNVYPSMNIWHLIVLFITAMAVNKSMSYLMVLADCKKPNLTWNNEMEVVKQNNNKLFQYVVTIGEILIIMYLSSVLTEINMGIMKSILIIMLVQIIIFAIINTIVLKLYKKQKLFNKIN